MFVSCIYTSLFKTPRKACHAIFKTEYLRNMNQSFKCFFLNNSTVCTNKEPNAPPESIGDFNNVTLLRFKVKEIRNLKSKKIFSFEIVLCLKSWLHLIVASLNRKRCLYKLLIDLLSIIPKTFLYGLKLLMVPLMFMHVTLSCHWLQCCDF